MDERERGYVKLYRRILSSGVFANAELLKLFILCLCHANHKEQWVQLDSIAKPVLVQSGQFITGRQSLHKSYYPRKKPSNKSLYTVWRWLKVLKDMQILHLDSCRHYTVVTVCHWDLYQNSAARDTPHHAPRAPHPCTTDAPPARTNNNDNNEENDKNEGEGLRPPCPPLHEGNSFKEDAKPGVQMDADLTDVLAVWAQKLGVANVAALPARDQRAWSAAVRLHGKEWCLAAIARARSIHAGVVIVASEKRQEQGQGPNDAQLQAEIAEAERLMRARAEHRREGPSE